MMKLYLKGSDIYYLGRFSFREEKGLESWIILIEYYCLRKDDNEKLFDPVAANLNSSVAVKLSDIERAEVIYEKDSKTWKRLVGNREN